MKELSQLSTRDLEQLSSYLDGELSPRETERLRERLDAEPALKLALSQLRATAAVLHELPQVERPRSFTLTHAAKPRGYPVLQFSTALVALAFIVLVSADLVLRGTSQAPEQAMNVSEEIGAFADADNSLDLEAQPEAPSAGLEAEGAQQLAAPAEGSAAEESAAEVGETALEEAETRDEFFKSSERDAEPPEAVDLERAEDAISDPPVVGEIDDSGISEQDLATETPSLLLPGLRIGELIIGLVLVLLVSLTLWARRR